MTIDLGVLAPGLERHSSGIWFARSRAEVSYPEGGHAACLAVEENSFWFRHRNRCIAEVVGRYRPTGALLDIGGGNGYVARGLLGAGIDCALIEPGLAGARAAHARGVEPVICARLEDAGFRPGSFAAAGLFDVLEHIEDESTVLKKIGALLMPGGRLFVTVPAYQTLFSPDDVAAGHYRRYSPLRLANALKGAGFSVEYQTCLFWPLPLPVLLFRTLPGWFGRGQGKDPESASAEHTPTGLMARLMDRALAYEGAVIARGGRLPFGGSCLAVARREPTAGEIGQL